MKPTQKWTVWIVKIGTSEREYTNRKEAMAAVMDEIEYMGYKLQVEVVKTTRTGELRP